MSRPLVVDTDVLIDHLRGHATGAAFVDQILDRMILSAIVVAELYAGAKTPREQGDIESIRSCVPVVPITAELARQAGLYMRQYAKSHGIGLADAIVAATAESENADLATLNVRHYPMFSALKPAYTKS